MFHKLLNCTYFESNFKLFFYRMDKIKINNQVVVMRKFVKQAKTRVINKWVKEIKLLQNRKGDENQVSKCKRKADRLLSEISLLQKIKPDNVSKMALSKAKDWKAILTQKNIPLEDRCLAVLANYGPVQAEVEKFHSANSYLVPKIATLVQEWEEKAKLTSKSPQKNKGSQKSNKPFQKSDMKFQKSDKGSVINLNQSRITHIEEKCKTGNTQLKSLPHLIVKKQLEKEESEPSDIENNASDSSSEDIDETLEENEKFSNKDNLNSLDSQKILKISENKNNTVCGNSDSSEAGSSSNEDDSVTQKSEDELVMHSDEEDDSDISQKSFEPVEKTVSQVSELMVKSVKNSPKHPKKSTTKTEKNAKEQPTFQKTYSPEPNSTKAVTLINLNEMLDMDEIPIDNNRTAMETVEETGKRKRDAFFLTGNGEDFSENDNEDSDDGKQGANNSPFRKKQRNSFNKKGSYNERFENKSSGFKSKKNFGNSPHGQKFGFREKGFQKSNKVYNSKEQSVNYGRNQERGENRFNNNRFNKFEKNGRKPENQFNRNKNWNTGDKSDRTERKSFKTPSGKTFEKPMSNNKNRNDYSANKRESFNKSGGKKDELPLHPSWEAKRKLKTPVTKFQGKRIVFND